MNILIVDREALALKGIKKHTENLSELHLILTATSLHEALNILNLNAIDVLILDIEMPGLSDAGFFQKIIKKPLVILTTPSTEYASITYDLEVIDYLVKPISFNRFSTAIGHVKEFQAKHPEKKTEENDNMYIFITINRKVEKIYCDDILYIESLKNYIAIQLVNQRLVAYKNLNRIETELPSSRFIRVQKSFIVAKNRITGFDKNAVYIYDKAIPVSKLLRDKVFAALKKNAE